MCPHQMLVMRARDPGVPQREEARSKKAKPHIRAEQRRHAALTVFRESSGPRAARPLMNRLNSLSQPPISLYGVTSWVDLFSRLRLRASPTGFLLQKTFFLATVLRFADRFNDQKHSGHRNMILL